MVTVTDHNDKTWFDMAGNFHSEALKLTERYTMLDRRYDSVRSDRRGSQGFHQGMEDQHAAGPAKEHGPGAGISVPGGSGGSGGDFERDPRTWYPQPGSSASPVTAPPRCRTAARLPEVKTGTNLRRTADGKPDLTGYYNPVGGGANYGLERHGRDFLTPATRGVVIDPPDGIASLPALGRAERINRELPYRGYDDPTAHCFVPGVPRAIYTPSPVQILQPPGYVVLLFERMSWRIIRLDGSAHIPTTFACGRAIRWATGKAIRWWWTRPI